MLTGKYELLYDSLSKVIDSRRLITNPLQLLAYGTDASFYRLIPQLVVYVNDENELKFILKKCNALNIAVTYRAAGTSLSGQAISDSVLLVATHNWKDYFIQLDGELITLEPGIIGAKANNLLKPYGRKIGPDPASINSAMIGGIASNNASGMCCGTSANSYKTISDIRIILSDGTILDTSDDASISNFKKVRKDLVKDIEQIRDQIKNNKNVFNLIKTKFKIKNTTGYSINAFVDYSDPIDIIKHLMIGSEGTLAFISNITYETVTDEKYKSCTLIFFKNINDACSAVPILKRNPVAAVELLDRASIRSVENDPDAPDFFKTLPEEACALLIECQANEIRTMTQKQETIKHSISHIEPLSPYWFTSNPKEYNFNWKARKGLLSTVGGLRKTGTTCIIEDVAVPIENLAEAVIAIQELFKKYKYTDAVLFGHALDGNLHLNFSQDFGQASEVERYKGLMDELADIIVDRFNGSLKAEHGTGRNMAPFVEKEWGEFVYQLMVNIKNSFDPKNLINPGVIINYDPESHIKNLKPLPAAHEMIDKCMECGFCEASCVAEGLTLSPRQRIVIAREISALRDSGVDEERLYQMQRDAVYNFDETCATDGLCGLACPVKIDTGKYVKLHRFNDNSKFKKKVASYIGHNMDKVTSFGRSGLGLVSGFQSILGNSLMQSIANGLRVVSEDTIPRWNQEMPKSSKVIKITSPKIEIINQDNDETEDLVLADVESNHLKVVYFPSCINRTMGKSKSYDKEELELTQQTEKLLKKAGYEIIYPQSLNLLCCGMAFSSKGFTEEGNRKRKELEDALFLASDNGKYPILFDMSPCFYTFIDHFKRDDMHVYDPIEFMHSFVLPKLEIKNKKEEVVIFPVCSVKKIYKEELLEEIANACANSVTVVESNCCGFAGDRGFSYPELNKHGLRILKGQIPQNCNSGYSTSRTCEIGLAEHSGINFKSIFYLIDEVTV